MNTIEEYHELTQSQIQATVNVHKKSGRAIAFVGTCAGLGIAYQGEPGYWPVLWYSCPDFFQNMRYAHRLNADYLDLDEDASYEIIASSMREQGGNI